MILIHVWNVSLTHSYQWFLKHRLTRKYRLKWSRHNGLFSWLNALRDRSWAHRDAFNAPFIRKHSWRTTHALLMPVTLRRKYSWWRDTAMSVDKAQSLTNHIESACLLTGRLSILRLFLLMRFLFKADMWSIKGMLRSNSLKLMTLMRISSQSRYFLSF